MYNIVVYLRFPPRSLLPPHPHTIRNTNLLRGICSGGINSDKAWDYREGEFGLSYHVLTKGFEFKENIQITFVLKLFNVVIGCNKKHY